MTRQEVLGILNEVANRIEGPEFECDDLYKRIQVLRKQFQQPEYVHVCVNNHPRVGPEVVQVSSSFELANHFRDIKYPGYEHIFITKCAIDSAVP